MSQKIEKEYSEVFYYCIQEAVYWKLKAEIYNNSEQDKKRMQDPTKSSSCKIHSQNCVTKYVYIPTDRRNIDESKIDLELTKVGVGARSGVNNVMLVVKEIEECKKQNTLDMMLMLSVYGAPFNDRGIIMVTEECKRTNNHQNNVPNSDVEYLKSKTVSEEYLDIIRLIANENRIFLLNKKSVDQNRVQTLEGEIYQNQLFEIGKDLYRKIVPNNNEAEFHVEKARTIVDELRVCDKALIEFKSIQELFRKKFTDVKTCLDNCKNKDHPDYLEAKERYGDLKKPTEKKPFYEDNPEKYLDRINTVTILEKSKFADATILIDFISAIPDRGVLGDIKRNPKNTVVTVSGIGATTSAGAGIGGTIGILGGPIGVVVGGAIGGVAGGAVGGISAAIGYAVAKNKKNSEK